MAKAGQYLYDRYYANAAAVPIIEGENPTVRRRTLKRAAFLFWKRAQNETEVRRAIEGNAVQLQEQDIQDVLNAETEDQLSSAGATPPRSQFSSSSLLLSALQVTPTRTPAPIPVRRTLSSTNHGDTPHRRAYKATDALTYAKVNSGEWSPEKYKELFAPALRQAIEIENSGGSSAKELNKRKLDDAEIDGFAVIGSHDSVTLDLDSVPDLRPPTRTTDRVIKKPRTSRASSIASNASPPPKDTRAPSPRKERARSVVEMTSPVRRSSRANKATADMNIIRMSRRSQSPRKD